MGFFDQAAGNTPSKHFPTQSLQPVIGGDYDSEAGENWQRWQSVFIMYTPLKINIKPTHVALEDDFPVKLVIFGFHEKCSRVCDYRAIFKIGGFLGMSTQFYQVCVP